MRQRLWPLLLCGVFSSVWAVKEPLVTLATPKLDPLDRASVLRGGENFKRSCLSCHSLKYTLYNPVVKKLGITKASMPVWPEEAWGGHPPPDLSLEALASSPNWIYTYLMTYYEDKNHSTGFNNLAYPNTSMPNPFASMQGKQILIDPENFSPKVLEKTKPYWYRVIKLDQQGKMSADQFETYVKDIVNFLQYVADPSSEARANIGGWVVLYLFVFSILLALVYRFYLKESQSKKK